MKKILSLTILLVVFSVSLFAQENVSCPSVKIYPKTKVYFEGTIAFWVEILTGVNSLQPEYKWIVSTGNIKQGQGTPVILVEGSETQKLIATVDINGLPQNCANKFSTFVVIKKYPYPEDVFSGTYENLNELKNRVIILETELEMASPKPKYIVFLYYKPANPSKNNFNSFRLNLKKLLLKSKKINLNKILLVDSEESRDTQYPEFATYWFFEDKEPTVNHLFGRGLRYVNVFGKEVDVSNLKK